MIDFSDPVISDRLQAFTRALDAGDSGGKIKLYGGTKPAPNGSHTQTLLCELSFKKPSALNVVNKVLTLDSPFSAMALVDGTVSWCRLSDSNGNWVADCDAGGQTSNAVFRIQNENGEVYAGGQVIVNQAQLKEV